MQSNFLYGRIVQEIDRFFGYLQPGADIKIPT